MIKFNSGKSRVPSTDLQHLSKHTVFYFVDNQNPSSDNKNESKTFDLKTAIRITSQS